MKSLLPMIFVALCASGCAKEARLPGPNEEKADNGGTYSEGDVGFWTSYMDDCPVTESDKYRRFYHSLKGKGIAVFPGVVRNDEGTTYDLVSRDTIASFFKSRGVSKVQPVDQKVGFGGLEGINSQWDWFKKSMSLFSDYLRANPVDSGYALMAEYGVNGTIHVIQCYIFDSDGEDAFSFLLNSHHKLFADAQREINAKTSESRDELIGKGTDVIIKALQYQFQALSTE